MSERAGPAPATDGAPSSGADAVRPVMLPPNQLLRFYAGGPRIDELRGVAGHGPGGPEDWVGSTTTAFGQDSDGLSRLADRRILREAIAADPVAYLGAGHVQRWGANPALLVKLLDAGERLPVHFHPGRAFAREALGLEFGKTEAWIIVTAEPGAVVHLGLKAAVPAATVSRWLAEQDVPAMLAAMHELPVHPGQALFVPAGTLHAIGAGILLVELQEPTDLSVLLEWQRFGVSSGVEHLGLGWQRALAALDRTPAPPQPPVAEQSATAPEPVQELLPEIAAPYFRAQRIVVSGDPVHIEQAFSILVVLDGWLTVWSQRGERLELARGATALIPHSAGKTTFEGHARVIRCLPPAADAEVGQW